MTGPGLRAAVEALAEELEARRVRAAIYRSEWAQGHEDGEDTERLRISAQLRRILAVDAVNAVKAEAASERPFIALAAALAAALGEPT